MIQLHGFMTETKLKYGIVKYVMSLNHSHITDLTLMKFLVHECS